MFKRDDDSQLKPVEMEATGEVKQEQEHSVKDEEEKKQEQTGGHDASA